MKLNGWMRLWIALSACWAVLIGYLAYDELSSIYKTKTFEVAKDEIGKVEFVFSSAQSDSDIKRQIADELIPLIEKAPKDYVNKIVSAPYDKYLEKHASVEIWKYLKVMLLPVFGLLVFGWSFVWVRRGFRGNING